MVSLPATYAASSWPMYAAAHGDAAPVVRWVASALSLGLLVGMVFALAAATAFVQRARIPKPPRETAVAPVEREVVAV